ncbi:kinase-like domain-containing protein [Chaetomium sp. MPI-CAGE-AT-0009]|nr:kinase-like domain-containing protein [Chaetomium sp. MPI-CAGE-AT-0009]
MWWDTETIEQTVTKQFARSRLKSQEAKRLDQIPSFGEALTSSTYWEWIEAKSKKTFLVLADLGLASHIFELIDDSLDDEDLPFSLEQVQRLKLTPTKNERTEKKFYHRQFHYLLRHLGKDIHIDYEDPEVVPCDIAEKPAAGQNHRVDKVTLPNQPGTVFCRYQMRLGTDHVAREEFMYEVNGIKNLQNEHMLSYWASYTHQGYGYILFTPAPEFSLKSLLTTMPSCLKKLDKITRGQAVMNWIYCLVDTVCSLHNQGRVHRNIRPSTVHFSKDNFVFFSGFTQFHINVLGATTESTSFDREIYDYGAPENVPNPAPSSPGSLHQSVDDGSYRVTDSNPQAADIFSLGCVILELLSFLFKKQGRPFAAHRAEKHRAAGRGNPFPDSSFHDNVDQVESWMEQLAKDASKKDDPVFKGVVPILEVVVGMLSYYPSDRLTADKVREKIRQILAEECGIPEPHCLSQGGGWDFGAENRLSSGSMPSRGSGSQYDNAKRSSAGSGGSANARSFSGSLRDGGEEATASRARNGSQSSYRSAHHTLKQQKSLLIEGGSFLREF